MPKLSQFSKDNLKLCDEQLVQLFEAVAVIVDIRIVTGHRDELAQGQAFLTGHSKKAWPDSNHNKIPSKAVDVVPFPIDWEDKARFYFMAGIKAVASWMGVRIRGGYDWDSDGDFKDQTFNDLAHFELI